MLLKKRLWHRCFPVNFAKFLRTPFFTEYLWWLLLNSQQLKFLVERFVPQIMQCRIQMYFGIVWMVYAPKKILVTLFPYLFHVKPKWNIIYEYLKRKIFSRDSNILPQIHWTSNISGHSATIIGSFWVSLNYQIPNFKKKVCPKNVWMRHCI